MVGIILGSVGLLLMGMKELEKGVTGLVDKSIKKYLQDLIDNKYIGWLVGLIITPLLQSSSVVSLLLESLVGAKLVRFKDSLGVTAGMNVGITLVPLLLTYAGFGGFDLLSVALPLVGVGGILLMLIKKGKRRSWLHVIAGLGVLLLSIIIMKDGITGFSEAIDISAYTHYPLLLYLFIGLGFTALVQSSVAVIMMTIASYYTGLIGFDVAIYVVIGSNIGTTFTGVLGAIGTDVSKIKVAIAHCLFNILLALCVVPFLRGYQEILRWFGSDLDAYMRVAWLNFLFNFVTSLVFLALLPWIKTMIDSMAQRIIGLYK